MNINQLRYFVAAVDNGSFSAAGSALFVTSQAVSKAVAEMERETGMKMLIREGKGVHTTEFGRLFYRKAIDIVHSFSELESLADDFVLHGDVGGVVNVALAIPFFRGSMPIQTNFDVFSEQHPDAQLNVFVNTSNAFMLALEEDVVDAAVILGRSDNPDLACYKITEIQPQLIVPIGHPLAKQSKVRFRD
ncbi:MAG: LysR family transcriptional regulator, partial [Raoultibacter sp.]